MSKVAYPDLFTDFKFPAVGAKVKLTAPKGAGDSIALVSLIQKAKSAGKTVAVVCAQPSDVTRLTEELAWLDPELSAVAFPDWETLPYDTMSPHADLVSERIETLYRLSLSSKGSGVNALIATAVTAAQKISPKSFVTGNTFFFKVGQTIRTENLEADLVAAGYGRVEQVVAPGEFCVRGGIVDIFPMGVKAPLRLDLFDDEIESIKYFDPDSQRSTETTDNVRILPGHEFPIDDLSCQSFRQRWREAFSVDPNRCPVYKDIGNGVPSAGIEYYLPLFFEETATLADYLPEDAVIVTIGDVEGALTGFMTETRARWEFLSHDQERPALPPEALFQTSEAFYKTIAKFGRIALTTDEAGIGADVEIDRKAKDPAAKLKAFVETQRVRKAKTLIVASSRGREARLSELLREGKQELTSLEYFSDFLATDELVTTSISPLLTGFRLENPAVTVITENELYSVKATARRSRIKSRHTNVEAMIRDISELRAGDPVVHIEHGIGRYQGLETIVTSEGPAEFVSILYANDAKLFVPVAQLHLISRYTGMDSEHAPLHSLGRGDWEKARKKAAQKARDTAAELLHLYAMREARPGFVFNTEMADYEAFCEGFAFEETPDQATAIDAVIADMHSGRPMDRLVCGDVGFGKTEVALRAAFVAAMNGKQVAVLCPTTLLAEQHAQTFRDRFAAWPVKIAELSRFRSGKQTAEAIKGLAEGTVDIAIGTHQLLSEKVQFKRLGLVVIDEEHRFGVRQKERLKSLRSEVDVLTLTATPIPRTLAMSLDGIRDFSVIATAPQKRLAIKTFVRRESKELIREAVIRELKRGGQVYFLHNEVETILNRAEMLRDLIPEARVAVAHGQMAERELEGVMRDFYRQTYNLLVCTTIIETGIDVPIANTIIMHRADKFGLAQLHQLRGRVGRSHHQAYAYLLTPGEGGMTKNAERRLEAIQNLEDLGSGFYLAMHDLEIRGAGEVLGDSQSGEMAQVGFDLYNQMLQNAVRALKKGEDPQLEQPFATLTEINLHVPALLPDDYVGDVSARLGLYKRLAASETRTELEHVVDDLNDRFGKLPEAAKALIAVHRLRLDCKTIGIKKIDAAESMVIITFIAKPHFEPMKLIQMLQTRRDMRMLTGDKLKITAESHDLDSRLRVVRTVVNALLPPMKAE
ncbi:MAG: transcription-repair coupling factor [Sutterellaceae bacterium]|nr:transcription-repair coupling factor [Sutterellaceae bacterium]